MGKRGENIRKRKDGRWEARLITAYDIDGKAKYRSFYGRTYREAKEKRNQYQIHQSNHQQNLPSLKSYQKITVKQLMQEWLFLKKDSIKDSTYAHYQYLLEKHIFPQLGEVYLLSLTTEMINEFLKEKLCAGRIDGKGGLSSKTVSDIRSIILLGLEYAEQQKYPCAAKSKIFSPRTHKPAIKVLSKEEQCRLELFLCQHPEPLELGILITLYGGLRIGELCALQWADILYENGTIRVNKTMLRIQNTGNESEKKTRILIHSPKTESSDRFVPLPSFILNFIEKYRRGSGDFLLTGSKCYMEPRMCLWKYKQILEKAGIRSFTFHALRHTFATRCVENGFDPKSLSEILGHANVNTTLINYVHPSLELKKQQMERLKSISVWGQKNGHDLEENTESAEDFKNESYSVLL